MNKNAIFWRVILAMVLSGFIVGCATVDATGSNWRQDGYDVQARKIGAKVKSKELTAYEGNKQMISVTKSYFPNDPLLIGIWEDLTELAKSYVDGTLSEDRFNALVAARWDIFDAANLARHQALELQQAEARRDAFMQNFLSGVGRSMGQAYPKPINCATTSMPGVISTTCR